MRFARPGPKATQRSRAMSRPEGRAVRDLLRPLELDLAGDGHVTSEAHVAAPGQALAASQRRGAVRELFGEVRQLLEEVVVELGQWRPLAGPARGQAVALAGVVAVG